MAGWSLNWINDLYTCIAWQDDTDKPVLMTYVSGEALQVTSGKSDAEIVAVCVDILRKMFPEEVSHNSARKIQTGALFFFSILNIKW